VREDPWKDIRLEKAGKYRSRIYAFFRKKVIGKGAKKKK
jgi:hypothetical protein